MTSEPMITPFADNRQNNGGLIVREANKSARETDPTFGPRFLRFIQALEFEACGEVNRMRMVRGDRSLYPPIVPAELRSASRVRTVTIARKWCCHALYTHRAMRGRLSFPKIGVIYNRDHSTVRYEIRNIGQLLQSHPGHLWVAGYPNVVAAAERAL